jgi:hypothetical protein
MNSKQQAREERLAASTVVEIVPSRIEKGPLFQEAKTFTVTRLPGGLSASLRAEKAAATRRRNRKAP